MILTTSDGLALEAELARPAGAPLAAVVLAHPHPQQGGSMRSLVTSELFKAIPGRGLAVLRFNFRGVGDSEGGYGEGVAEKADIVAAIDTLVAEVPDVPVVLAGWSFGADVSLTVLDPRLRGWFLVAPPLRVLPLDAFVASSDPRPKWFTVPERDQFRPPAALHEVVDGWENVRVEAVPGADHFLVGRTVVAVDHLEAFVSALVA